MNYELKNRIATIRKFNRFYTNILGLLGNHFLDSNFSLAEVRVLHEIEKNSGCTSKMLTDTLSMDSGYLSRIIKQFEKYGMITKERSPEDGRAFILKVTPEGQKKMKELNTHSDKQICDLIAPLTVINQERLVKDMTSIQSILDTQEKVKLSDITIRNDIRPGDAGYIIHMHGWIYKEEYNYTTAFEAYVAQSFYEFLLNYNPDYDRLWVAEHNNEIIGCIGVIARGKRAQLRWFLLHPNYRGIGLGKHLLNSALAFCREKEFQSVYLDTTNDLDAAIFLYTRAGFVKVSQKENHSWKDSLLELEYEMQL